LLEVGFPDRVPWRERSAIMLAPLLVVAILAIWKLCPADRGRTRVVAIAALVSGVLVLFTLLHRDPAVVSTDPVPDAVQASAYVRTFWQAVGRMLPVLGLLVILPLLRQPSQSLPGSDPSLLSGDMGEFSVEVGTPLFAVYVVGTYDRLFMLI